MTNLIKKGQAEGLTPEQLMKEFAACQRTNTFSREGFEALHHFFNDLGDAEQIELDVDSFCSEFVEYPSIPCALKACGMSDFEQLESRTYVVKLASGGVFLARFIKLEGNHI